MHITHKIVQQVSKKHNMRFRIIRSEKSPQMH